MLCKKVLMSLLTIGILAAVVGSGTWAYFSSSASSVGNTIKTGKLSLELENGGPGRYNDITFNVQNAMPGDTEVLIKQLDVKNKGNIPGKLTATVTHASDSKGLGKYLTIKVGNQVVYHDGSPVVGIIQTDELNGYLWNDYQIIPGITYTFENKDDQSTVMGDTFTGDIVFTLQSVP